MAISPINELPSSAQPLERVTTHSTKHNLFPYSALNDSNNENPSPFIFNGISSMNQRSRSDDITEAFQTKDSDAALSIIAMPPTTAGFASSRKHNAVCDYNFMLQKFPAASLRFEHQSPNPKQLNFQTSQCLGQEQEQEIQEGFVPQYAVAHRYRASTAAQYNHFSGRGRGVFDFHHSRRIKIFLGYLKDIDSVPEDVRYWHDETCFIIKDRFPKVRSHD
ncbi:hypothetical protein BGZ68_006783 [Mortierella alpina]|nr:hypothetical protein BGZ68_006783 [Mortierella alpina]